MNSFLVTGLESSCTRHVSILLAKNLGVENAECWDGHDKMDDGRFLVVHKSLPHGSRENFIDQEYWQSFGTVILCTRDINCSLESKIKWHQGNRKEAEMEQEMGRLVMDEILRGHNRVEIYSYESSFLIGRSYNEMFFSRMGVPYLFHVETKEINSKYFRK